MGTLKVSIEDIFDRGTQFINKYLIVPIIDLHLRFHNIFSKIDIMALLVIRSLPNKKNCFNACEKKF